MSFLEQFDALEARGDKEAASALLFHEMNNTPEQLCEELRAERPILRFWSKHPSNPDLGSSETMGTGQGAAGYAFLLTRSEDVRIALEWFSMKSYSRMKNRYFLSMDEEVRHEKLRNIFKASMDAVDDDKVVEWLNEAVEEAWDLQYQDAKRWECSDHNGRFYLDVRQFSREVTMRFCGRFYGLPRAQVLRGRFRELTGDAFTQFIWKLFARHFVETPQKDFAIPELAKIAVDALMSTNVSNPVTFTDHLVRINFASRSNEPGGEPAMTQKDLVSNLIGGFQGFIDNAVSCTCLTVGALLRTEEDFEQSAISTHRRHTFKHLQRADSEQTVDLVRDVLCEFPPAPWLPRVGNVMDLPGWADVRALYNATADFEPDPDSSCILAIGSAMADYDESDNHLESSRPDYITSDEARYKRHKEDLSLGYGYHRCVGLSLSDIVVAGILKKIATLEDVQMHVNTGRKWSWIVKSFAVSSSSAMAPDWTKVKKAEEPVAVVHVSQPSESVGEGSGGHLKLVHSKQLKNIQPSVLALLTDTEFACLSDKQLNALTDSQLNALSANQIAALDSRINVLLCEQIVMLSRNALSALNRVGVAKQPLTDFLDADKVHALLDIRSVDLGCEVRHELNKLANQHNICRVARQKTTRPHAHSLWSRSYNTGRSGSYTTWPGLVDKTWTARHLPAATDDDVNALQGLGDFQSVEKPGLFTALFQRPDTRKQDESRHTSLLFTWFAQWVSDSFLRTDLDDRRRNQSNHQVDLCQLYGLNEATTRMLRENAGGRLLSDTGVDGNEYLPRLFDCNGEIKTHFCALPYVVNGSVRRQLNQRSDADDRRQYLFAAGLDRGNSTFGYTAISTLFLREHNRICAVLMANESTWDDERLFQTTRMILTVMLLNIVMTEYISHIASATPSSNEDSPRYAVDRTFAEGESWYRSPRITLEFNLLYRWHSMVPSVYKIKPNVYNFAQFSLNNRPLLEFGLGKLLNEASCQAAGRPGLFNTEPELLRAEFEALKMSRDYRVASFNKYRVFFGLPEIVNYRDLTDNELVIDELKKRYKDPSEIELLVGLYAEDPAFGRGLFGGLMTTMLGYDAFTQALTNPLLSHNVYNENTFTSWGLEEIKGTRSLNDLWMRNGGTSESDPPISMKLL